MTCDENRTVYEVHWYAMSIREATAIAETPKMYTLRKKDWKDKEYIEKAMKESMSRSIFPTREAALEALRDRWRRSIFNQESRLTHDKAELEKLA